MDIEIIVTVTALKITFFSFKPSGLSQILSSMYPLNGRNNFSSFPKYSSGCNTGSIMFMVKLRSYIRNHSFWSLTNVADDIFFFQVKQVPWILQHQNSPSTKFPQSLISYNLKQKKNILKEGLRILPASSSVLEPAT